jgi:hypothetical protein
MPTDRYVALHCPCGSVTAAVALVGGLPPQISVITCSTDTTWFDRTNNVASSTLILGALTTDQLFSSTTRRGTQDFVPHGASPTVSALSLAA